MKKILTQSYTYWFTLTLGVALKRGYNLTLTPLPTEHARDTVRYSVRYRSAAADPTTLPT